MRDSTGEVSGTGYTYASGGNVRMLETRQEITEMLDKKLLGEKVFFEQQVTGELLLAARTNVIDDIAYMTLLKFFEERGLSEEDLRRRKVTIRYSVEPV